jgi:hypothetical protein
MSDVNAVIAQGSNPLTMANNVIGFQRQQTALSQDRFNLQQAQLQPAYAGLNALLENPNANWNDVNAALANSARLGGNVSGLVQNATDFASNGGSPADFIRQYGTARYVPPFEAANLFLPQYAEQRTAMGTYPGQVSGPATPGGPQWSPSGFVARGVAPEQWNAPVPVGYNAQTGAVMTRPYGEVYGGTPGMGGGGGGAPGGMFGPPGGMVAGTGPGTGGNVPGSGALGMIKNEALMNVMLRESGGQNIRQIVNGQPTGPASGYFQIEDPTWRQAAPRAGVDLTQYPTAMSAPLPVQYAVASALYDQQGLAPWQASAGRAGQFPGADAAMVAARGQGGGGVQNAAYYPPMPGMGGGPAGPSGAALPPGFRPIYGPGLSTAPPPPGTMEAATTAAQGATQRQQTLVAQASQATNQIGLLNQLQSDLQQVQTGVGSNSIGFLRQIANRWNIEPQALDTSTAQAAQESFNKVASQIAGAQMGVLGGPSDARQDLASHMNPTLANSKLGNERVIQMLIGNQQAIQVMNREWGATGQSPAGFDNWRDETFLAPHDFTSEGNTYSGRYDPRVFWLANMPGVKAQNEYVNTFSGRSRTDLINNMRYAESKGWVSFNSDNSLGVGQ